MSGGVDWSALPDPASNLSCVIVLPARNESLLINRALQALARQQDPPGVYEVIVLANNCSDDTADRARAFATGCDTCSIHVIEVSWPAELANVGRARRALMDQAAFRLGIVDADDGLIVSTDADTRVTSDWLAAIHSAIDAGADAVGGRIVTEDDEILPPATARIMRLDDSYQRWRTHLESIVDPDPADPWPRHHQHFGASLAVTAAAYRAVNDHPLVPFLEDVALVNALRKADLSLRHSPDVRVHTSARLDGRAKIGLSWQLREWSERQGSCPEVPDPAAEMATWAQRAMARAIWQQYRSRDVAMLAQSLAELLAFDEQWLLIRLETLSTFGSFWNEVQAQQPQRPVGTVPMDEALRELRRLVRSRRAPTAVGAGTATNSADH